MSKQKDSERGTNEAVKKTTKDFIKWVKEQREKEKEKGK